MNVPLQVDCQDGSWERELADQAREIARRIREGTERLERLRMLTASAEAAVSSDERLFEQLQSLLPSAVAPSLDALDDRLRGARLHEVALEVLARRARPGEAVHYREWYAWMGAEGFQVAGRDPLATFLAQITRLPDVRRVGGGRSGRYMIAAAN